MAAAGITPVLLLLLLLLLLPSKILSQEPSHSAASITASFGQTDLIIGVSNRRRVWLELSSGFSESACLEFTYQSEPGAPILGNQLTEFDTVQPLAPVCVPANSSGPFAVEIAGSAPGQVVIGVNSSAVQFLNLRDCFLRVRVIRSQALELLNAVVGVLYLLSWSASFYPQTILNCRRRSVVGLSFDFVGLNLLGFLAYSAFNIGMYCVPAVQAMYFSEHPRSVMPVQLADVLFAAHAAAVTSVQTLQCCLFDRGGQRVSLIGGGLLVGMSLVLFGGAVGAGVLQGSWWLQYLYLVSYVKLAATVTKYSPQVYLNWRRQSTLGWSLGQVYLDFFGGFLSTGQLLLLAYNYNDWGLLAGDGAKLGLGVASVVYDCIFFVQHYCLYGAVAISLPLDSLASSVEITVKCDEKAKLLPKGEQQ